MRQISRIEDDQTHTYAWLVRVQRRNQVHHRYFSDRRVEIGRAHV